MSQVLDLFIHFRKVKKTAFLKQINFVVFLELRFVLFFFQTVLHQKMNYEEPGMVNLWVKLGFGCEKGECCCGVGIYSKLLYFSNNFLITFVVFGIPICSVFTYSFFSKKVYHNGYSGRVNLWVRLRFGCENVVGRYVTRMCLNLFRRAVIFRGC